MGLPAVRRAMSLSGPTLPSPTSGRNGSYQMISRRTPRDCWRLRESASSIVFSSDQNGTDPNLIDFARVANVLVLHLAIAAGAPPGALHASPALIHRLAQRPAPSSNGEEGYLINEVGVWKLALLRLEEPGEWPDKAKNQAMPFCGYRMTRKLGAPPVQMVPGVRLGMGKRR
jgi:hypothetical protein